MGVKISQLSELLEPFSLDDIEWRIDFNRTKYWEKSDNVSAFALCYVTSRAIMRRFDDVCGPENWTVEYTEWKSGAIAKIFINIEGQGWVSKEDGADPSDIEGFKGMISGALKRAAVLWGVGRYLYDLPATKVNVYREKIDTGIRSYIKRKTGPSITYWWEPPVLPLWARPIEESYDLNEVSSEVKTHIANEEESKAFKAEIRMAYRSNDVNHIIRTYGEDIIRKLKKNKFKFQKGD